MMRHRLWMKLAILSCWVGFAAICVAAGRAGAAPVVFWASDPIRPGETVLVSGEGFGERPSVEVWRLGDGPAETSSAKPPIRPAQTEQAKVVQPGDKSLKFLVPGSLKPGLYAYRLSAGGASTQGLLNRPAVWWALGDGGTFATPGGSVRFFGKNLARPGQERGKVTLLLQGPRSVRLTAQADCYAGQCALPRDLPTGEYQLLVHSGCGGAAGWSEAITLRLERPKPWPAKVFNVRDFEADGTGSTDATEAVQAALTAAGKNGGGVVFFPRGRYQVNRTLTVPRFTVLRGERREWVNIFWPDMQQPPPVLITGTNSFGLEDLTLYCGNYKTFLAADTKGEGAGDVFLRRLCVRADLYRGHITPEEVDRRYRGGLGGFGGGYWLAVLGGRNVEVSDCDLYSSGCTINLTNVTGARLERNAFRLGRLGGCGIFEGDGVLIADNEYLGSDLTSACGAGGLGYGNLSNLCLARNKFTLHYGMNGEAITSDAPGGLCQGPIAAADATSVTLPATAKNEGERMVEGAVHIVAGKGAGQWRRVARVEGQKVTVDTPWQSPPDANSTVVIAWRLSHWLVLDNDFTDVGIAVQFYGSAIEHIAARNRCSRSAGFHNFGMSYNGVQPSWYVQWLDNEILEGNIYRADHDQIRFSADSHLGVYGLIGGDWKLPITLGTVLRRNHLHNNASIVLGSEAASGTPVPLGRTDPLVTDVIVEHNTVEDSNLGLCIFQTAHGVYATGNHFRKVKQELWDEAAILQVQDARRKQLQASPGPVAVWDFGKAVVAPSGLIQRVPDASGHGFDAHGTNVQTTTDAARGKVGKFNGDGYLSVDDPAVFNLQSVTFSLWIKPDAVKDRQGLLSKRFMATSAPYMLSLWNGGLEFEGNDENGQWSFIFHSPAEIKAGEWTHLAAVVEVGKGVTVYCNGKPVGHKDNPLKHCANGEPLIIGRDVWSGLPNQQEPAAFFRGCMAEMKLWARALTEQEVQAEAQSPLR